MEKPLLFGRFHLQIEGQTRNEARGLFLLWNLTVLGVITAKLQQKEICDQQRTQNNQKSSHNDWIYTYRMQGLRRGCVKD